MWSQPAFNKTLTKDWRISVKWVLLFCFRRNYDSLPTTCFVVLWDQRGIPPLQHGTLQDPNVHLKETHLCFKYMHLLMGNLPVCCLHGSSRLGCIVLQMISYTFCVTLTFLYKIYLAFKSYRHNAFLPPFISTSLVPPGSNDNSVSAYLLSQIWMSNLTSVK